MKASLPRKGGGGWLLPTPYNGLYGEGYLFQVSGISKGRGFTNWIHERAGIIVIAVSERASSEKGKKTFWFCDLFIYYYYYYYYYYLEDSAFTVVKRMRRCLLGIWKWYNLSVKGMPLCLSKMVFKTIRVGPWDRACPYKIFFLLPPPPPPDLSDLATLLSPF